MPITATTNLLILAQEGCKWLRRLRDGRFRPVSEKRMATHRLKATFAEPRILKEQPNPGVILCVYHDPFKPLSFTGPSRLADAQAWVASRKELVKNSAPYSAVAMPIGRKYKNFAARRAEMAACGSLYLKENQKQDKVMPAKTTKKPAKPVKKIATASKGQKTPKAPRERTGDIRNGIRRPSEGTLTAKIWAICDRFDGDRGAVLKEAAKREYNGYTVTTHHNYWRKYNGLSGRTKVELKAPVKKKPAPPVKPKAKKTPPAPPSAPAAVIPMPPAIG